MNPEIEKKLEFIKKCVERADYIETDLKDEILQIEIKFHEDHIETNYNNLKIYFNNIQQISVGCNIGICFNYYNQNSWLWFRPLSYTSCLIDEY